MSITENVKRIRAELPEGVVELTVTALNDDGSDYALAGARTFFRLAPFVFAGTVVGAVLTGRRRD